MQLFYACSVQSTHAFYVHLGLEREAQATGVGLDMWGRILNGASSSDCGGEQLMHRSAVARMAVA